MLKSLFAVTALLAATVGTAHAGSVTVYNQSYGQNYGQNYDQTCREFTSTVIVGNHLQQGVGTACQQGDGSWAIVAGPGVGTSFIDNGIPVAYPANNYVVNAYPQPVYYPQPVRVRYIFTDNRVYRPAPVIITRGGPGWGYYGRPIASRHFGHEYGYGRPSRDWDNGPRRDRDDHHRH